MKTRRIASLLTTLLVVILLATGVHAATADIVGINGKIYTVNEKQPWAEAVAIKGIGGFHLCCDATDDQAVERLRQRKRRPSKPLAIMSLDRRRVRSYCHLSPGEEELLCSPMRPIVILERRDGIPISAQVAPRINTLGVMLPYAPVHVLLLEGDLLAMVATSAKSRDGVISFERLRHMMTEKIPVLLLFGTAWGLSEDVISKTDHLLAPIAPNTGYNHLSVRSAAAIMLDRLLGNENKRLPGDPVGIQ